MLTMRPEPRSIIAGRTACVHKNVAVTLIAKIRFQSSSAILVTGADAATASGHESDLAGELQRNLAHPMSALTASATMAPRVVRVSRPSAAEAFWGKPK